MAFTDKTRRKIIRLGSQGWSGAVAGGGLLTWDIPKTGLLAGIFVHAFVDTSAAGWAAVSAKGTADTVLNRVRLVANSGIDVINMSGGGLVLMKDFQEDFREVYGLTIAASYGVDSTIAAAGTFTFNFFLPLTINRRDPLGMFMLQNEATLLQLQIDVKDAVTAGGAASLYDDIHFVPYLELYSVPADPKDWPPLNVIHQLIEETRVTAAGAFEYKWPRGNTYAGIYHAHDTGAYTAFSDNFTAWNLTVNQSDRLIDSDPDHLNMEYAMAHGRARQAGRVPIDFLGTSGLGAFGSARDMLYSAMVTEISTNFTVSAAGQLYTLRRQLVALKG